MIEAMLASTAFWMLVWIFIIMWGVRRGAQKVRAEWDKRVQARIAKRKAKKEAKAKAPDIPGPVLWAMKAAEMAAMLRYGWGPLREGVVEGAKVGWAAGRQWADKFKPPAPDPEPEQEATDKKADDDAGDQQQPAQPEQPNPQHNGQRPKLDVLPGGAAGTNQGDEDVDINNIADLIRAAKTAHEQAVAELQDATAAVGRVGKIVTRLDAMVTASKLPKMKLPPGDQRSVVAAWEKAQAAEKAAERHKASATDAASAAKVALDAVSKQAQFAGVAAGEAHQQGA